MVEYSHRRWGTSPYTETTGVLGGVDGRVGVVRLVPLSGGGACCHEMGSELPPLWVAGVLLDDSAEVKGLWEGICLCAWVAYESLCVQLLCNPHGLLSIYPQLTRTKLLHFLQHVPCHMHVVCMSHVCHDKGICSLLTTVSSGSGLHLLRGRVVVPNTCAVGFYKGMGVT